MKYAALAAQIAALTMSLSSNHQDAMGWAAAFAVLCVVVVAIKGNAAQSNRIAK